MKMKKWSLPRSGNRVLSSLLAVALLFGLNACELPNLQQEKQTGSTTEWEPVTVVREAEPPAAQIAGEATALALRQYVYARLATEALASADLQTSTAEELTRMTDEVTRAWELAAQVAERAEGIAGQAITLLESQTTAQDVFSGRRQIQFVNLAATQQIDPKTWAENLTKQFDALKGAQKYKQLAEQLGTDAKSAYAKMVLAQEIIHNQAMSDAELMDTLMKTSQVIKTTCKVGLFVTSTIVTGGGTVTALSASSFTLAQTAGVVVGGVDCIVDIADTGSNIVLGEGNQVAVAATDMKKVLGPVSSVLGLLSWTDSGGGEKLSYIGDALTDWFFEGKIMGVQVSTEKDGSTKVKARILDNPGKEELEEILKGAGFTQPEGDQSLDEVMDEWNADPEAVSTQLDDLVSEVEALFPESEQPSEEMEEPTPQVIISEFSLINGDLAEKSTEYALLQEFFQSIQISSSFDAAQNKYSLSGNASITGSYEYVINDATVTDSCTGEIFGEFDPQSGEYKGQFSYEQTFDGKFNDGNGTIRGGRIYLYGEFSGISNPGETSVNLTFKGTKIAPTIEGGEIVLGSVTESPIALDVLFSISGALPMTEPEP